MKGGFASTNDEHAQRTTLCVLCGKNSSSKLSCGGPYRAHDIDVARAHAEIAAEAGAYFFIARFCIVAQQFESREDHPRRAKAALQRMMLVKCHLQRMEFSLRPNPFNGGDFAAIGLRDEEQAGTHRAAVEQDRACAAHAMFAADVSPDQTDIVA